MPDPTGDRSASFPAIERKYGFPMRHWFDLLATSDATTYDEQMALLREGRGFSRAHANAVVMTHRGSSTTRRFATPDDWFASVDPEAAATARAIFAAIQRRFRSLELVTAWNQPMLKAPSGYVFGLSAAKAHLTLNPFSKSALAQCAERLAGYRRAKQTFQVPFGWEVDAALLEALVRARLAELD
ncbi:MAG: DUF4287 domain-containing protein [Acidimicrobiia bacterium]|nr:DUF4287 domain-containing protein [Acidimicrobiia bacterium]